MSELTTKAAKVTKETWRKLREIVAKRDTNITTELTRLIEDDYKKLAGNNLPDKF